MNRFRKICIGAIALSVAHLLATQPADAQLSDAKYAKCQQMYEEQSEWLLEGANKADAKFDKMVAELIEKRARERPDPANYTSYMTEVIDRVYETNDRPKHRRQQVENVIRFISNQKNDGSYQCWKKSALKSAFKNKLLDYEYYLDKILERAVKERLELEELKPDEGLVVVMFYARGRAEQVKIDRLGGGIGSIKFGPVIGNNYFRVVKAKAGRYRWDSVTGGQGWDRSGYFFKDAEFDFDVEAGKLNYVGAFYFQTFRGGYARLNVYDRAAVLLSLLEENYPELLDGMEIRNGVNEENRFIEFYLEEKARLKAENNDA